MKKIVLGAVVAAVFLCVVCNDSGVRSGDGEAVVFLNRFSKGNGNGGTPTHTHTWGNWVVTTPATCDAAGVETRTCTQDASHKETRAIAKLTGTACESGGGNDTKCDATVPVVTLVGAKSVTITTQDVAAFRKWMHLDGGPWSELIKWGEEHKNVDAKKPRLTRGGSVDVAYEDNKVPEAGSNYVIVYRVEKPVCDGKVPADEISRNLIIEQYLAPDTLSARISLVGSSTVDVKDGVKYIDDGVVVMVGSQDSTKKYLDSVVVKRGTTVTQKLTNPVDFSKIDIQTTGNAGYRYTITYYASRNGKSVNVVRTVNVIEMPAYGLPEAVIVLNTYTHTVSSKTIYHPDTMMYIGSKDTDYKEKGVKEVYCMKEGKKEAIAASLVEITVPSGRQSIANTNEPAERIFSYKLSDGAGYKGVTVTRTVYMTDNGCDVVKSPTIKLLPSSGAIEIPAGVEWIYNGSWEVANTDIVQSDAPNRYGNAGFQYLIDFNGGALDPKKPVVGTYTITYVGLGKCGKLSDPVTRSVTVK